MRFFNRINLHTPESVELEFSLAGIGNRALALLIDYHVVALSLLGFSILWIFLSTQLMSYLLQREGDFSAVPPWLLAVFILGTFAIYAGYFIGFEVYRQGQTPGKRFAKIRVIRDDGRPIGLTQAALRSLLRPIDDFFFIGALFILFGKREKRIGDWVAGTIVVQETGRRAKPSLALSDRTQQLVAHLPTLANLRNLHPDDLAVIREYLDRRKDLTRKARHDLSLTLACQVRSRIQLEAIPDGLTSDEFLEAVYLAVVQA
ncbi:RDD family protein [Thermoleptolyngbya sichuanensis A183]|uniref:RDD family protein n=1 Tax=Thermoleptolyngbya sichuanensis A183 TaxID=2737172 RepID=A0A6M8BLR0_9CYAN|nr:MULTISPECIES: RDD family protein [Thermoleptolyngbya]QKD83893.1 RDD family protein [Thermoleptolyngbya sichuanensis A183]